MKKGPPMWETLLRFYGGPERTRTSNPWFRRPVLYPLSYGSGRTRKMTSRLHRVKDELSKSSLAPVAGRRGRDLNPRWSF